MKFLKIFKKDNNIIIGAIHLPPLVGYSKFPGFSVAIKNALADLKAFEKGGADGIIFENNYDLPHKIFVDPPIVSAMTHIGKKLKNATMLPMGISVLWNDYRAALSIAKKLDLQFIRVPVFIDDVKTDFGIIKRQAKKIIKLRNSMGANHIALLTDIHVKHSELLSDNNIVASAKRAIKNHSDAVIITGQKTGDSPVVANVEKVRKHIGSFPILIGSGLDKNNAVKLFEHANGAIVSTSLKYGTKKIGERNIKSYQARIGVRKVDELTRSLKTLFVVATHGNETIGVEALDKLRYEGVIEKNRVLIGNPKAFLQRKRYVEADLNRVFPGNKKSRVYEERLACKILEHAQGFFGVIDIHGTNDTTGTFIIVSNPTPKNLALARLFDIKNIVLWPTTSGRATGALTRFIRCGIGIECGSQNEPHTQEKLIRILRHYLNGVAPKNKKRYFLVYDKLPVGEGEQKKFKSFQEITLGREKFFPLMVDRYQNIKCYKMKEIDPLRQQSFGNKYVAMAFLERESFRKNSSFTT